MKVRGLRLNGQRERRRSARFRARVEGLEVRLPLAFSADGYSLSVPEQIPGSPISTFDPNNPNLLTVPGRPVPLVNLRSITDSLSASDFSASVDWGDGSPPALATIVPGNDITLFPYQADRLLVEGPSHTYATAGDYTVTVAVVESGGAGSSFFQTTIPVVDPAYRLTGRLDPASDRGRSGMAEVVTTATPTFSGTAQPGEPVTISAYSFASRSSATTTSTVADASGHWSLTSAVLGLGGYTVVLSAPRNPNSVSLGFLEVDTAAAAATSGTRIGTAVSGFKILDARQGTFEISFHDASATGLRSLPLTDAGNYSAKLASGPRSKRSQGVSNLGSNIVYYVHNIIPPILQDYAIDGRIGDGTHPLPRNATITLTVRSAGITNAAGVALDGEFRGKYPSGDGNPGGDYQVRITLRNGRVADLKSVLPAKAAKLARATGHHA